MYCGDWHVRLRLLDWEECMTPEMIGSILALAAFASFPIMCLIVKKFY